MDFYHLYLDESAFNDRANSKKAYCVAGIVVRSLDLRKFRSSLARLKYSLWENEQDLFDTKTNPKDRIFHEAEIRSGNKRILDKYPYYKIFSKRHNIRKAVNGVGNIIENNDLTVLGCIVDETSLESNYLCEQNSYTSYKKCLNSIITNYNLFLLNNNAHGDIILESRKSDNNNFLDVRTRKMFYKILSMGTNIYSAQSLQDNIRNVKFVSKQSNEAGLQIADFVPRPFLLNYLNVNQSKPSIYQVLRKHRYDNNKISTDFNAFNKYGLNIIK